MSGHRGTMRWGGPARNSPVIALHGGSCGTAAASGCHGTLAEKAAEKSRAPRGNRCFLRAQLPLA